MEYSAFLGERRQLMAGVVRDAFERLKGSGHPDVIATDDGTLTTADVEALIEARESQRVEFKTSMRASEGKDPVPAKVLEKVIAKTVAGFMNAEGGTLLIGVRDDGEIAGLDADLRTVGRHDFDGFEQALCERHQDETRSADRSPCAPRHRVLGCQGGCRSPLPPAHETGLSTRGRGTGVLCTSRQHDTADERRASALIHGHALAIALDEASNERL